MVPQSSWCVLHVNSNQEKRVAQSLAARSVEHYLPLYTERRRWGDRNVIVERPLFSGYVFARFFSTQRLDVISTPGVLRMLGEDPRDLVCEEEIDRIRVGLASGLRLRPHPSISIGTKVRVLCGVFAGMQGIVREFRSQCSVVLSLSSTHQCFSLEIDLNDLEEIKESAKIALLRTSQALPLCSF